MQNILPPHKYLKLLVSTLIISSISFILADCAYSKNKNNNLVTSDNNNAKEAKVEQLSADAALNKLMTGNKRYLAGQSTCGWTHTPTDAQRREQLANMQKPFAIILGCSDSRVPPEIVFDQRLGDLFVVRVAGNIVDDIVLGSVEYAVKYLAAPTHLVMVLGHERCGAVTAAVNEKENGPSFDNHINSIMNKIAPVIANTKKVSGRNFVDDVITNNIKATVNELKTSTPLLVEAVKSNRLKIVGARYNLDTGEVKLIEN